MINRFRIHTLNFLLLSLAAGSSLSGCAMSSSVQRMGVEYNEAVAGMANNLMLLNIVRAKEGMPLHYTSISSMTGTITVKATSGFNAQIKDAAPTDGVSQMTAATNSAVTTNGSTTSGMTAVAPTGTTTTAGPNAMSNSVATTIGTTVTNAVTSSVVRGGNIYAPSIGGEVDSGPQFNIAIFDSQTFEQGILASIPFSTVENYIDQGYSNQLILRLLVERVEFKLKNDVLYSDKSVAFPKGTLVKVLTNSATGDQAKEFASEMACYMLSGVPLKAPPKVLAPLSRVTRQADGKTAPLKIEDLARFDGTTFELDGEVSTDGASDDKVKIERVKASERVAKLTVIPCAVVYPAANPKAGFAATPPAKPAKPPSEPLYIGSGKFMMLNPATGNSDLEADLDMDIVFRSTEGVVRFLGDYLHAAEMKTNDVWLINTPEGPKPLFSVTTTGLGGPVVSADLRGKHYFIRADDNLRQNMQILAIAEQLVNLHKSSSDKPVTLPVQVLP